MEWNLNDEDVRTGFYLARVTSERIKRRDVNFSIKTKNYFQLVELSRDPIISRVMPRDSLSLAGYRAILFR